MGNGCCFAAGPFAASGRKAPKEPVDPADDIVPSGGRGGRYAMTEQQFVTPAKIQIDDGDEDRSGKQQSAIIYSPEVSDKEVEVFFEETRLPDDGLGHLEQQTSADGVQAKASSKRSHKEVFKSVVQDEPTQVVKPSNNNTTVAKTHTQVFSLSPHGGEVSSAKNSVPKTSVDRQLHVDGITNLAFIDENVEELSPKRSSGSSSTSKPQGYAPVSDLSSSGQKVSRQSPSETESEPGKDPLNRIQEDIERIEGNLVSTIKSLSVDKVDDQEAFTSILTGLQTLSRRKDDIRSMTRKAGGRPDDEKIAISDESDDVGSEDPDEWYGQALWTLNSDTVKRLLDTAGGVDGGEGVPERQVHNLLQQQSDGQARLQRQRDKMAETLMVTEAKDETPAEIQKDISKIETNLCATLKADADADADVDDGNKIYVDVMNELQKLCKRTEDLLRGNGKEDVKMGDSWHFPELADLNLTYKQQSNQLRGATATRLLGLRGQEKDAEAARVLGDYETNQKRLIDQRQSEKQRLLDKLQNKLRLKQAKRDGGGGGGSQSDEEGSGDRESSGSYSDSSSITSDEDDVREHYDQLLKQGEDHPIDDPLYTSNEDVSSSAENGSSSETEEGVHLEAKVTLNETFTKAIQSKLGNLTADEFGNIMTMYRQEHDALLHMKDSEKNKLDQILQDKLERRKMVSENVALNGELEETEEEVGTHGTTSGRGGEAASKKNTADAGTDVGTSALASTTGRPEVVGVEDLLDGASSTDQSYETLLQGLRKFDKEFVDKATGTAGGVLSAEEAKRLLVDHWQRCASWTNQQGSDTHLTTQQKDAPTQTSNGSASDSDGAEGHSEAREKEKQFDKEEEDLKNKYISEISRRGGSVSSRDLELLLERHRRDQQQILKNRSLERQKAEEKLKEKMEQRRLKRDAAADETVEPNADDDEKNTKALDDAFFAELCARRQREELSKEDVGRLIEQHLDDVEQFKRNLRHEMASRRRQRQMAVDSEQASALVQEEQEAKQRLRRLRNDEKQKMDAKLQEKLRKKRRTKVDNSAESACPDLPPPRRQHRKHRSSKPKSNELQGTAYENVLLARGK